MIRAEDVAGDESIVEKVVAKRFRKGNLEYKVLIRDSDIEVVSSRTEEIHNKQFPQDQPAKQATAPSSVLLTPESLPPSKSASTPKKNRKRKQASSALSSCGTLPMPLPGKVYRCQRGSKIETVLGVRPHTAPFNFIALVKYDDGKLEIVPTRTIAEVDPEILIGYYEERVKMPHTKADATMKNDAVRKPAGRRGSNVLAVI